MKQSHCAFWAMRWLCLLKAVHWPPAPPLAAFVGPLKLSSTLCRGLAS